MHTAARCALNIHENYTECASRVLSSTLNGFFSFFFRFFSAIKSKFRKKILQRSLQINRIFIPLVMSDGKISRVRGVLSYSTRPRPIVMYGKNRRQREIVQVRMSYTTLDFLETRVVLCTG